MALQVGTSDREGRTAHVKSLSVSRSIQNGIDWHVPVVVVTAVPKAPAATNGANGPAGGTSPRPASPGDQYRDRAGGSAGTDGGRRSPAARQGDAGMGGEGQRESRSRSPSPGAAEAVEKYLGAPPAPPAPVSRAVRRQQERKPGDWDWNRLGHNYRTNWTTMHGGAYTQGECVSLGQGQASEAGGAGRQLAPLGTACMPLLRWARWTTDRRRTVA